MVDFPSGPAIRFLRQAAKLTQPDVGKVAGVSYQMVAHWERGSHPPKLAQWDKLEPLLTLGMRQEDERVKWLIAAWAGDHMQFLYAEGEALGVWLDRGVAYDCAAALRGLSGGYINAYALPCWADYIADLAMEGGEAWFPADERGDGAGITEWFAVRARCADHVASVMRQYTAVAAAAEAQVAA
jgi:DNA-binding XRE family transcriptional regulator